MLGTTSGTIEDVKPLQVSFYRGVFVPPPSYSAPEPLPPTWLECLPPKKSLRKLVERHCETSRGHLQGLGMGADSVYSRSGSEMGSGSEGES